MRKAAVLVLLTEGPQGVQALLTERAHNLRKYPGQMVFPGGKNEETDADLTDTALRESREEVGLDRTSVDILGSLSPFMDPEKTSTVTPVLAWSGCPKFPGTVNAAEVAAIHQLPIRDLPAAGASEQPPAESAEVISKLGTMTADILDAVAALLKSLKVKGA
jgi:8-oxo-dGTP pyrophosphatase MutT (NUDIX family)